MSDELSYSTFPRLGRRTLTVMNRNLNPSKQLESLPLPSTGLIMHLLIYGLKKKKVKYPKSYPHTKGHTRVEWKVLMPYNKKTTAWTPHFCKTKYIKLIKFKKCNIPLKYIPNVFMYTFLFKYVLFIHIFLWNDTSQTSSI